MQLSKRESNIVIHLLAVSESQTTQQLADLFNVSVRTIKYDLDNIKLWLEKRNYELHSKRSKGIWLELQETDKLTLKNEILNDEKVMAYPHQEIRLYRIVFLLLLSEDYLTAMDISHSLLVSKNTVMNDLDKIENLLKRYDLMLLRKNRQGFYIEGNEHNIRLLMETIIQKQISEFDIYKIMMKFMEPNKKENQQKINIGINEEFQKNYEISLTSMSSLIHSSVIEQFDNSEILSISIRTAISITRMQKKHSIGGYKVLGNQKSLSEKHEIPFILIQAVFESFELPILEEEYLYIYSDTYTKSSKKDVVLLTRNIITWVSEKMTINFNEDERLFTNLFAHLSLRLAREHMYINEYNPFVVDIKMKYPHFFTAIQEACEKYLVTFNLITNDSFIAYICLHFLVSYEKGKSQREALKVVYICSTGLGVTSLIQQKIMEEVNNIEIAYFASILNANEIIKQRNPDLVISIFPLENIQKPFIKVNPIPSEKDIKVIQNKVDELLVSKEGDFLRSRRRTPKESYHVEKKTEDESREIIVQGFVVYESLKQLFKGRMDNSLADSFLLHVFLMIHRIHFDTQYDEGMIISDTNHRYQEDIEKVEKIFSDNDLVVNKAEIAALFQYLINGEENND